jgi:murein DD-endopeptidase MepM/ murein hydrolase activator NlpD
MTMRAIGSAIALWAAFHAPTVSVCAASEEASRALPPFRVVDLNIGERQSVRLPDETIASVSLLEVNETRGDVRGAVRQASVVIELSGQQVELGVGQYNLPVTVGRVQVDCPVTKGYLERSVFGNIWALEADARLRVWPAGSPWLQPETFIYPVRQRWFASDTQMANEPVFVDGPERPANKRIYYHYGLDIGGAEALTEIVSATDGVVVSSGERVLEPAEYPELVEPRFDVVYVRDQRGWYYRYAHLYSIDPSITVGARVRAGRRIGLLGKEASSGAWSHLHFDISGMQPSGRYGIVEGYAFLWEAYVSQYKPVLQALARPHRVAWTGEEVTLDASRSWSVGGARNIVDYRWELTGGTTAPGAVVARRYDRPGTYSEILRITDREGNVDYDFTEVQVLDPSAPEKLPPTIHAAYWPTFGITVGDEVTFKVRSYRIGPKEGREVWDFGDGSPRVAVQSDGNADKWAKHGYAVTTHRYQEAGQYVVSVSRANDRGETATAHLHVVVDSE